MPRAREYGTLFRLSSKAFGAEGRERRLGQGESAKDDNDNNGKKTKHKPL